MKLTLKFFYDNLKEIQERHFIQPDKIFYIDETFISTVQRNQKLVVVRGQKQVGKATSAKGGLQQQLYVYLVQPVNTFFYFYRKRMNPQLLKGKCR